MRGRRRLLVPCLMATWTLPGASFVSVGRPAFSRLQSFLPTRFSTSNEDILPSSPIESRTIHGRTIWIKRDDCLALPHSEISGNKARKMWSLNQMPVDDFPDVLASYGGSQSNAMLALAKIVASKQRLASTPKRFVYYTKRLPKFLKTSPSGNLLQAQQSGVMDLIELSVEEYKALFDSPHGPVQEMPTDLVLPTTAQGKNTLWIPQGGASEMARAGVERLAREVVDFWNEQKQPNESLLVIVPGGTCTTAAWLVDCLQGSQPEVHVAVVPCVGDSDYAKRQMKSLLDPETAELPLILPSSSSFSFGKPHTILLETFHYLLTEHDLPVDLMYGAPAWHALLHALEANGSVFNHYSNIMYVHSGGLEGLTSQLARYRYQGLLSIEEVDFYHALVEDAQMSRRSQGGEETFGP